jgi:nucleotide-binding universal stress UspA family protein
MIRKLLVAYDGSAAARAAFDFGAELALKYGAELHVVAVARPPEFGTEEETEAVIEQSRAHYEQLLEALKPKLARQSANFTVAVGHPADQIIRYAESHAIDHIVVGHRGRTLFERLLVGSVARQVVAHARCGVSVLR